MTGSRALACPPEKRPESGERRDRPPQHTSIRSRPQTSFVLNSVRQPAPASRTFGRYAVDPDGPILDPATGHWRLPTSGRNGTKNGGFPTAHRVDGDPSFRDDNRGVPV